MFNKEQIEQIILGQNEGLDVSIYAKEEIDAADMRFIRKCMQNKFLEIAKNYTIYNKEQKMILIEGIKKKLDIQKIADQKYSAEQMNELLLGLENDLDISIYAKQEYDEEIMELIRISLMNKNNLYKMVEVFSLNDINSYSFRERIRCALEAMDLNLNMDKYLLDTNFNVYQLLQILKGLKHDVDVELYDKCYIGCGDMKTIRHALERKIDITIVPNYFQYKGWRLEEIIDGIEKELDISYYLKQTLDANQTHEIKLGLLEKVDVSVYNKPEIPYQKMRVIRKYLKKGINLYQYVDICTEYDKLELIGQAISEGIDVSNYIDNKYSTQDISYLIVSSKANIDMTQYLGKGFDYGQLEQIYNGLEKEIDISTFAKPEYDYHRMRLIIDNYFSGLDISVLTDISINIEQLSYIIKIHNKYGVNMYPYVKRKFGPSQLSIILEGLRSHVDVSAYAKKSYKIAKMEAILKDLIIQKNKKNSV